MKLWIAAALVCVVVVWLLLSRRHQSFDEEGPGTDTASSPMSLAVRTATPATDTQPSTAPVAESASTKSARTSDKRVVIAFPDGSKVDLTLRYLPMSPRPLPWPNKVIDQYEQLRS